MPRKTPVPDVPAFDTEEPPMPYDDLDPRNQVEEPVEATFAVLEKEPPVSQPIRALVPKAEASDHHLVVGMATLAEMSEADFDAKLAQMERGQERLRTIQTRLLKDGEDYGRIKGIEKPFLHQPGAEKLANFYGLAVRQEAERITRQVGDDAATPPFAYHVKSFVHLGDFEGPIVAMGFGEANSYEDKYHYRFSKPACPVCSKVNTILRRKTPPQLAGKMQCANFGDKDGCGTVFEPGDPRLGPTGKEPVPDADLFGLAETILLMASKRSHVAAVRRATGTSGLFTQDADSPSVVQQSEEAGPPDGGPGPVIESVAPIGVPVAVGGKTTQATQVQHTRLKTLAMENNLNGAKIADLLSRLFGMDVEPNGKAASEAVRTLDANQMGQLLLTMETGDLPLLAVSTSSPSMSDGDDSEYAGAGMSDPKVPSGGPD